MNSPGQDAAGRGMASGFAVFGCLILVGMGIVLTLSTRNSSLVGIIIAIIFLAFPLLLLGGPIIAQAAGHAREKREAAKRGRFASRNLTLLAQAVAQNDIRSLKKLLELHPDLTARDEAGATVLGYAVNKAIAKETSVEIVRALLDAGADPNQWLTPESGPILLRIFEASGPVSDEMMKHFLDRGADPNTRDNSGVTLLHRSKDRLVKLKLLLDHGAELDAQSGLFHQSGWSPAMALTMEEAYDEALYLVQRGADVQHIAPDRATLTSLVERRRELAAASGEPLPESFKALAKVVMIHARR